MVELVTDANFKEEINSNEKVIVKYFADWCGSCKLFAPKFRRLSETADYSSVKFLDINAEENPEARKLAGVSNLPFFAVFKNGELVAGDTTAKEETVVGMLQQII